MLTYLEISQEPVAFVPSLFYIYFSFPASFSRPVCSFYSIIFTQLLWRKISSLSATSVSVYLTGESRTHRNSYSNLPIKEDYFCHTVRESVGRTLFALVIK